MRYMVSSAIMNRLAIPYKFLFSQFHSPICDLNCGDKCAPYNELGVPFCCDTSHVVPSAYMDEWNYLDLKTDLWHEWCPADKRVYNELMSTIPADQILLECQGHENCQREYRTITCRSFPFFPYLDLDGKFLGMSYYWEYEDRCWVISNLGCVSKQYREQFIYFYDQLFSYLPDELMNYRHHSILARRIHGRKRKAITLLHRNGYDYKITPKNGRMRLVGINRYPKFGVYKIASIIPYSNEIE